MKEKTKKTPKTQVYNLHNVPLFTYLFTRQLKTLSFFYFLHLYHVNKYKLFFNIKKSVKIKMRANIEENMEDFKIIAFLRGVVKQGVSDVHLRVDEHPIVRKDGKILKISNIKKLTEEDLTKALSELLPQILRNRADQVYDLDFAYEIKGVSRFRVNMSRQLGKLALVIRMIPYEIPKVKDLMLPTSIEQFSSLNNGIVLVTGPTGSGKSTTIAALIEHINSTYQKHIITIEDPIEFIYTNKKCVISQRQIEIDTASFPDGVKYALRQDPDVILIGEIRDKETMSAALKAAETGHLVYATMHTNDAIQTVNRIVNIYEPSDREFIRKQLSETLRGTIAQKLLPRKNTPGRIPACEVLVVTPTVKDFIAKDKLEDVYDLVRKGSFNDMLTMNMSIYELCLRGFISEETALNVSDNKNELKQMLRGAYHGAGSPAAKLKEEIGG